MIDGCFDKLMKLIEDNAVIIAAVALGIAALEVQEAFLGGYFYFKIALHLGHLSRVNSWYSTDLHQHVDLNELHFRSLFE